MPALNFEVEWPDGEIMTCYSPSTAILELINTGAVFTVASFVETSDLAMSKADERVMERFGYSCKVIARQREKIALMAQKFSADEQVRVVGISEHEP